MAGLTTSRNTRLARYHRSIYTPAFPLRAMSAIRSLRRFARALLALDEMRPHLAGCRLLLGIGGERDDLLRVEEAHHRLAGAGAILHHDLVRLGIGRIEVRRLPFRLHR